MSNSTWRLGTVSNHSTAFVLREKRSIKYGQLSDTSCALARVCAPNKKKMPSRIYAAFISVIVEFNLYSCSQKPNKVKKNKTKSQIKYALVNKKVFGFHEYKLN